MFFSSVTFLRAYADELALAGDAHDLTELSKSAAGSLEPVPASGPAALLDPPRDDSSRPLRTEGYQR
jgi:hypothetical protein